MRGTPIVTGLLLSAASVPAAAMNDQGAMTAGGSRLAPADPGAELDRLAIASAPSGGSHARPSKSLRNVLRDDPNLRAALLGWTATLRRRDR